MKVQQLLEGKSKGWVAILDADYEDIVICDSKEEASKLARKFQRETAGTDMVARKIIFADGTPAVVLFDHRQMHDIGVFVAHAKTEASLKKKVKEMISKEDVYGVDSIDDLYLTELK